MKNIASAFLFIGALIIGFFSIQPETSNWLDQNLNRARQPSSAPLELKDWSDKELVDQIKRQLLSHAKVVEQSAFSGIELLHVQLYNQQGQAFSLCDELPNLAFEFVAEGLQYSNGNPSLLLEGRCNESEFNTIEPVYIDLQNLLRREAQNSSYQDSQSDTQVTLNNMHGEWPGAWTLTAIYFQDQQRQTRLKLSTHDFIKNLSKPLGLIMPVNN